MIYIEHEGRSDEWASLDAWRLEFKWAAIEERERMLRLATHGAIRNEMGPVVGPRLTRMRARLLGAEILRPEKLPWLGSRSEGPDDTRWLIPGLWPWGHKPILGGNPKAGKTTLIADLAASLVIPGRRFLNHFELAKLPDMRSEPWVVWVINAETPALEFEAELRRAGITPDDGSLAVAHLEEMGGPQTFDLSPESYEFWANWLVACSICDDSDDVRPDVVIVDGVTAILTAVGKGVESYPEFYAKFRRLMFEVGCENALAVFHNTLSGGHSMGGAEAMAGPDGLWTYSSDNVDRPNATRRFSATMRAVRTFVPATPVRFDDDGRLTMGRATPTRSDPVPAISVKDEVFSYIQRCNQSGHGPGVRDVRENVPGRNPEKDQALEELKAEGRIEKRDRAGRGGGFAYWVVS